MYACDLYVSATYMQRYTVVFLTFSRAWSYLCYFRILSHAGVAKCENNTENSKLCFSMLAYYVLKYPLTGVELNRKSPWATWARNKKILQAQLHIHEPNIVCGISIFLTILHVNRSFHCHFDENRFTAVDSASFCVKYLFKSYLYNYSS